MDKLYLLGQNTQDTDDNKSYEEGDPWSKVVETENNNVIGATFNQFANNIQPQLDYTSLKNFNLSSHKFDLLQPDQDNDKSLSHKEKYERALEEIILVKNTLQKMEIRKWNRLWYLVTRFCTWFQQDLTTGLGYVL